MVWAQRAGLTVGLLSARHVGGDDRSARRSSASRSSIRAWRASSTTYEQILADQRLTDDEVAYMGDDILDLPVLGARRAGGRAGRCRCRGARARALGEPRARRRRRRARAGRADPARAGPLGRDAVVLRAASRAEPGMSDYAPLLAALVALLAGLAIGKAWERYKLRDGKWIDRRRARESPHYILGLELPGRQPDRSGDRGAEQRREPRRRRARSAHDPRQPVPGERPGRQGDHGAPGLLQRPRLKQLEHAYVLLCLGLDYKRGGFVDRALEAFNEVLRLDPKNEYALLNLAEAARGAAPVDRGVRHAAAARRARRRSTRGRRARRFSRSSRTRSASRRCAARTIAEAMRRFEAAIDLDARAVPAYLNLGDVRVAQGNEREAAAIWEKLIEVAPDRAYLAFDRLEALRRPRPAAASGSRDLCRRLIDENPQDWRARLALSRHLSRPATAAGGARPAVRRARPEPARAQHPPGDLARARPAAASRRRSSIATAS